MIDAQTSKAAEGYLAMLERRRSDKQPITSDEIIAMRQFFHSHFDTKSAESAKFSRLMDINKKKRSYFGIAGSQRLQVKVAYDHLFIVRPYMVTSVSWRFNLEGRLEWIDIKVRSPEDYKRPQPKNIMKVLCEELPKDWISSEVKLEDIPPELVAFVKPGFSALSREERFVELVKYGHGEAQNVKNNLRRGLSPPHFTPDRQNGQYPLTEIIHDSIAQDIILKASKLYPALTIDNFPHAAINY